MTVKLIGSEFRRLASKVRLFFLDSIFPIECVGCGSESRWLCYDCFLKIKINTGQCCLKCKKTNCFGEFCPACSDGYYLNGVWAAADYEEKIIVKLIKSLKYNFINELSGEIGKILILFLDSFLKNYEYRRFSRSGNSISILADFKNALVIPVPLHKKRLRWRGFNQSEQLAVALSEYYSLELETRGLIRHTYTKPQVKLNSKERNDNVRGCFSWGSDSRKMLTGRSVLLIDDVVTTGATLNECAKVLKENGAKEVWGLVAVCG